MSENPFDPNDPSRRLSDDEWDVLWDEMTERRRYKIAGQIDLWETRWEKDPEYKKMVEKLIGGKTTWEKWQEDHQYIKKYDFQYLKFFHQIKLEKITFTNEVLFTEATFTEEVSFLQTTFTENAYFLRSIFAKGVNFLQAKFAKDAVFLEAIFVKNADFWQAKFQSSGVFVGTKFGGDVVNFHQMLLSTDGNLIFADAEFKNVVPDFRFLNRTPDIRFHKFSVPAPDELIKKNKWQKNNDNEDSYRKLKELAMGNDNHEYELIFYGHEMDSKLINFDARYKLQPYSDEMNKKLKDFFKAIKDKNCNKKWWIFFIENWQKFYKAKEKIFGNEAWQRFYKAIEKIFCNEAWQKFYGVIEKIFFNKKLWRFFNKIWWGFYGIIEKRFFNKKWLMDIVPTCLYKHLSNYGQSIWQPLIWLFSIWIAPFVYDCIIDDYIADNGLSWHGFSLLWFYFNSLWLALTSLSPDIFFQTIKPIAPVPFFIDDFKSLWHFGVKTIATVFWFFLFLGLRNKFKIK